jgi:serine/threonine protein kinase
MMLTHMFACFRPCHDDVENDLAGYKIVKTLGKGVCGSVHSAIKKDSWQPCALKSACLSAPAWQLEMAHREALALCQVGFRHVNLVQPVELVLSGHHLTLALKLCTGGTLESYCKKHYISEDMACYLLRQLVAVVKVRVACLP